MLCFVFVFLNEISSCGNTYITSSFDATFYSLNAFGFWLFFFFFSNNPPQVTRPPNHGFMIDWSNLFDVFIIKGAVISHEEESVISSSDSRARPQVPWMGHCVKFRRCQETSDDCCRRMYERASLVNLLLCKYGNK